MTAKAKNKRPSASNRPPKKASNAPAAAADTSRTTDPSLPVACRRHVVVVVLGDLGRSPRMQYHTLSLLEHGHRVTLVGYEGENLIPPLQDLDRWAEAAAMGAGSEGETTSGRRGQDSPSLSSTSSRLRVMRMSPPMPPQLLRRYVQPLYLLLRLLGLVYTLVRALFFTVPTLQQQTHPSSDRDPNNSSRTNSTGSSNNSAGRRNNSAVPVPIDCVLVQNPPSIPLLFLSHLFCLTRPLLLLPRPGLVIDWHNLGYTMFDSLSDCHPIRAFAKVYERIMAGKADGHLCVTAAMRTWLEANFLGIGVDDRGGSGGNRGDRDASSTAREAKISVLRDRPPAFFRPTTALEQHELFARHSMRKDIEVQCPGLLTKFGVTTESEDDANGDSTVDPSPGLGRTIFTELVTTGGGGGKKARLRRDRPALVVSSTSWTADEDFGMLLDACTRMDSMVQTQMAGVDGDGDGNGNGDKRSSDSSFPHVVVIVTGKGPQKSTYEEKISRLRLTHVSILTMWLESEDYPVLLGCADLGVSLHTSTSGIDLPMKVLDCYGCEVPVCAIGFACLDELVVDGINGKVFATSDQLADQMHTLLSSVGGEKDDDGSSSSRRASGQLEQFRRGIRGMTKWEENWDENAMDVILRACPSSSAGGGEAWGNGEPPTWLKAAVFVLFFAVFFALTNMFLLQE